MNCTRLQQVLDAHIDGELDPATAQESALHLAQCASCGALCGQRIALQQMLRAHAPRYAAPAALAPAIRRTLDRSLKPVARGRTGRAAPSWLHVAAFATAAALAGLIAGYWLGQPPPENPLREAAVASHVASLTARHPLIDVASSDRHTVKPWFQGKLDFAPPVKDLSAAGFTLLGARLEQIADRPAAAVVYRIRKHVINLFAWRAAGTTMERVNTVTQRGFSVSTWAADGIRYAAVSDVEGRDLARFATLLSTP